MTNKTKLLPCPFCGSSAMPSDDWAQCSNSVCPGFHIKTRDFAAWNTRAAPAEDVRAVVEEPVAYFYKEYVWATGLCDYVWRTKLEDEAPTDHQNVKDIEPLYRRPQRPVVLPERADASFGSSDAQYGFNACLDAVEELNK